MPLNRSPNHLPTPLPSLPQEHRDLSLFTVIACRHEPTESAVCAAGSKFVSLAGEGFLHAAHGADTYHHCKVISLVQLTALDVVRQGGI